MANELRDQLARLTEQLAQLQTVGQAAGEGTTKITPTLASTAGTQSAGSSGGGIGSTLLSVFGSGLGLSPLISGIASLFGGGGSSAPPPLVRFALPPPVSVNGGVSESAPGQAFGVDYAQGGSARPTAAPSQQITVQVQAMDSQSFLDRSNDIAMAVRQAMLESSVLNDVVNDVVRVA